MFLNGFLKWHHSVAEMPSFDSMVCVSHCNLYFHIKKAAKQAPPKTPYPPKRPPAKQYTQLSQAAAHPPAPHDYESLRPRARQQVMKRYSRSPPQDKQGTLIPLQDLYDDGQQTKRLSSVSKEGVTEDEDSEGTHA